MKVSTSLFEKRSHPELNPKISGWEALNKYKDNPSIFVSFTKLEKLGINPQTEYDTPAGVYFYPLKAAWKKYKLENKEDRPLKDSFPFAAEHPFIQIVQLVNTSKCLIVSKYSYTDYERDLDKLAEYFFFLNESEFSSREQAAQRAEVLKVFKSVLRTKRKFVGPATQLMHGTLKYLAKELKNYPDSFVKSKVNLEKDSLFLTFCLRKILGYEGIIDDIGEGAIHENEPLQAVFFNPRIFKHIRTAPNSLSIKYSQAESVLVRFITNSIIEIDHMVTNSQPFILEQKDISTYAKAKITERMLHLAEDRLIKATLSNYGKYIVTKLLQSGDLADRVEGRKIQDYALGFILPYVLMEFDLSLRARIKSIEFLNSILGICAIQKCTVVKQGLFNYNMLHLVAKYGDIEILRTAVMNPGFFGQPALEMERFLDKEYHDQTPFEILVEYHPKKAEEFTQFLKAMRPKIYTENPEAFPLQKKEKPSPIKIIS